MKTNNYYYQFGRESIGRGWAQNSCGCGGLSFSQLFQRKLLIVLIVCGFMMVYVSFTPALSPISAPSFLVTGSGSGSGSGFGSGSGSSSSSSSGSTKYYEPSTTRAPAVFENGGEILGEDYYATTAEDKKEGEGSMQDYTTDTKYSVLEKLWKKSENQLTPSLDSPGPDPDPDPDPKEMGCHLPSLNPFDESIQKYIKEPRPVVCSKHRKYPLLFTTDLRSTLIQVDKPEKYGYHFCCYNSFRRKRGSEDHILLSKKCEPINKIETLIPQNVEFIRISCRLKSSAPGYKKRVVDMLGFVHLQNSVGKQTQTLSGNQIQNRKVQNTGTGSTHRFVPQGFFGQEQQQELNSLNSPSINSIKKIKSLKSKFQNKNSPQDNLKVKGKPKPNTKRTREVNVVILGLDAISHMNLMRTMPRTFEYLTKNLSGIGMSGYTKVGDNTFPNIVPATTGLFVDELSTLGDCWKDADEPFDDCPFIWKDYSRQGYTTAYGEDAVWMGIFNYEKRGFSAQPTDSYFSTLTARQDALISHANLINANICYGPRLGFQVLLDYMKKMAVAMNREKRYFQFIWATSLFHDYLNTGKLGDRFLLETLEWFQSQGYFEDTVFILMSDHGIRWGGIRSTFQGKIEERMPFLYFVFPQWFREQYPSALRSMTRNQHKLTTPFDLYETLQDLLHLDNIQSDRLGERSKWNSSPNSNSKLPRGLSLFLEVPEERSCAEAEIPEHWCVCHNTKSVELEDMNLVEEASLSVVDSINDMLKEYPQCAQLELEEILNAQIYESPKNWGVDEDATDSSGSDSIPNAPEPEPHLKIRPITFSLSLIVAPSNGTFEATASRDTVSGEWIVSEEISRTNLYGQQSRCVADFNLKKFCYCR